MKDHGSSGIKIETPKVSNENATVKISGTISNDSANVKNVEIVSAILDKNKNSFLK